MLVIGAGIGQVNIVKLAQKKGCHVTVVSIKGDYPCISIADDFFECDIYDRDRIVEYAKHNHIDAVLSDQNDLIMPTVAYIAEKLNLPGNSYVQQLYYTDKNKFRGICDMVGVPVPKHIAVSDNSFPVNFLVSFPWVIKPADSQSSIGISKVNAIEEYQNAVSIALSKSKKEEAIVEEFFSGTEFVCEGFIYKGKYYHLAFGDRRYFAGTLLPNQTLFPSDILIESIQKQIIECEVKIASEINPAFGIVHSEYMVNLQTGDFCVIDSALRGGGVYISSHLMPLATGININDVLIDCALGKKVDIDAIMDSLKVSAAAYICFNLPEGKIKTVHGVSELMDIPNVDFFDNRGLEIGYDIGKMEVKGNRKGPIIIHADNREQLEEVINNVKNTLFIKVSCNEKESDIIWD